MPNYRRAWHLGGAWFFTVNLLERRGNDRAGVYPLDWADGGAAAALPYED